MQILQQNEVVKLVDRTMRGDGEIMADGQPVKLGLETLVHRDFVHWLYRTDKQRVWTKGGEWVHRYAVENPPQWLLDQCGPEVGECEPIEVDPDRLEGWDTTGVEGRPQVINVNIPAREMRERQGSGLRASTVKR